MKNFKNYLLVAAIIGAFAIAGCTKEEEDSKDTKSKSDTTDATDTCTLPFREVNGAINTIVPDGNGGWYIGGNFTMVNTYARNGIAHIKSNGKIDATWNPNPNVAYINTIALSGNSIYVGGYFNSIGGQARKSIAKLNNTNGNADANWNANIGGVEIYVIAINENDIYVGGRFSSIGGKIRNNIAKLNNTNGNADANWNPKATFSSCVFQEEVFVYSIVISENDIYVGGSFDTIGGQARKYVARLNNTNGNADITWNPNADGQIVTIVVNGNDIYVSGDFDTIGGQARHCIAKLNNTDGNADATWNANATLYPNANNYINSIIIDGNNIYVGGDFTTIGGQTRNYIAKLNNTDGNADATWDPNADGIIYTIALNGSNIYAGGDFTSIGGQTKHYIAKLNNTTGAANASW